MDGLTGVLYPFVFVALYGIFNFRWYIISFLAIFIGIIFYSRYFANKKAEMEPSDNIEFNWTLRTVLSKIESDFSFSRCGGFDFTNVIGLSEYVSEKQHNISNYNEIIDAIEEFYNRRISMEECVARVSEIHRTNIEFFLQHRMAA